jgi:opacity protein-like surface antigen
MKNIKSIFLAVLMISVFSSDVFSQAFADGTNLVYLGFGIPPNERIRKDFNEKYAHNNIYTDYKFNNYGTGVLKYEHGLHKYFGLGLALEYSASSASYKYGVQTSPYEVTINNKVMGGYVRFNGHIPIKEKFDIYGGVGLGYLYTLNKYSDTNPNLTVNFKNKETIFEFDYQLTLGFRFMVKDNIGLFTEFGWATTPAQVGIVFKF